MSKIILLNGAAKCGKDTLINFLDETACCELKRAECKESLHNLTMSLFNVSSDRYWEIYNNRDLKERALSEFEISLSEWEILKLEEILDYTLTKFTVAQLLRLSIREAMIYVSEIICKPRFGKDYFGKARVVALDKQDINNYIDGSCGFVEELPPLIEKLGQENILLLRIHREGCTFEGDSRDWVPDGVITNTVDIYNNGSEIEYLHQACWIVEKFLDE